MTAAVDAVRADVHAPLPGTRARVRLALLGVGHVGGALAALLRDPDRAAAFAVTAGLVRDPARERPDAAHVRLTANARHALDGAPAVVVEALGGLEPARTLLLDAIDRRIPVVTANKSLLAAHGDALFDAAAARGVPLHYEAAVLAGVPFLGTFARRPLARRIVGLCGIVNGTTNHILTEMAADVVPFERALADAQRLGYAEPDPGNDVGGVDAVEKLCVLLRHFGGFSVAPAAVETAGITAIEAADIRAADALDGALKPIVCAAWDAGRLAAFAGPAFLPADHPLARVDGVRNAVLLRQRAAGDLLFAGPGAGPAVTAATMLDDVIEIAEGGGRVPAPTAWQRPAPDPLPTGWFLRLESDRAVDDGDVADLLASFGVYVRRTASLGARRPFERALLVHPCTRGRVEQARHAVTAATGCRVSALRALEAGDAR